MNLAIEAEMASSTSSDRIADDLRRSGLLLDVPGEKSSEPEKPSDKPKRKRSPPKKKAEPPAEQGPKEDRKVEDKKEEPAKTAKPTKIEFIELGEVLQNPKKPGTAAYKRYAAMMRFLEKHGGRAPLADVLDKTDYNRADVRWDKERKFIRVFKEASATT